MEFRENVTLAPYTTFGIGGATRWYVEVSTEDAIREALAFAREKGVPFFIIAGGSNLLVDDHGFSGLVVRVVGEKFGITDTTLEAEAGCTLLQLMRATATEGIGGWERMAGIPGSIGGAIRGNAGAFGTEIKDVVTWVRALNVKTEQTHEFSNRECQFAYRTSYFKTNPEWIITHVHITLLRDEAIALQQRIAETIAEREKRHIQDVCAAGSFFLNPIAPPHVVALFESEKGVRSRENRVPAGWLIEKAGMKGKTIGGAQSSPQQANYLVNLGNATARDVLQLADTIKQAVFAQFGIGLREEAVYLGHG